MKRQVGLVVALALVSSLATAVVASPVKSYYPNYDGLSIEDFASPRAQASYATGFDEGEGYFPGNTLDGQNGWLQSGTNLAFGTVQQINPNAGDGHYRQVRDTTTASGSSLKTGQSPLFGLNPPGSSLGFSRYSVDMYHEVGADNFTEADFFYRSFSSNPAATGLVLSSYVDFFYQDGDGDGTRGEITLWAGDLNNNDVFDAPDVISTNVEYSRDVYRSLEVTLSRTYGTMIVRYGGVVIYGGALPALSYPAGAFGDHIDTLTISHDNYLDANPDGTPNAALGEFTDYDNVLVSNLPEPATLTLLALGAFGLIRRRR